MNYDLIVVGGGLSGTFAAVAAARQGANVLLIEKYGFLGGMATAGLVNPFMPYRTYSARWVSDGEIVNEGMFTELLDKLDAIGGLQKSRETFDEECMKLVLNDMVCESGVTVLFHTVLCDAKLENNTVKSITIANKNGLSELSAAAYIDASGDADIVRFAGLGYTIGRQEDGKAQPMTLCFRVGGVDTNEDIDWEHLQKRYLQEKDAGNIQNPREDILKFPTMREDVIHFNTTRIINKSNINPQEFSYTEIEAHRQAKEMYDFLKANSKAFANSTLLMTAPQTGVRESVHIEGEYTITADDIMGAVKFEDSICRGTYPIDIHNPSGTGTTLKFIPWNDYYTIPLRALIPKNVDNLIVAGRPISATHEAHSAFRILPICSCIGQAAGVVASLATKRDLAIKDVPYADVKDILLADNALI